MASYERVPAGSIVFERNRQRDLGWLLVGIGAVLLGAAALIVALYLLLSTVRATPFDADGVRCYGSILAPQCIKTAEPAR